MATHCTNPAAAPGMALKRRWRAYGPGNADLECVCHAGAQVHLMYARRKDTAHNPIAQGLKAHGFSVADTSRLGDDFPDLVIGKHGITALVEVKSQDRRKNGLKSAADLLSAGQKDFASQWKGAAVIVSYDLEGVLFSFSLLQKKMGFVR